VHFVEGHKFRVEWHCWFEVQMGEKFKSTLVGAVHKSRDNLHFGIQFVQKLWRKRLDALWENGRRLVDLQLCC
jgi:hypothetical protein